MSTDGENKKKLKRWLKPMVFAYDEDEPRAAYASLKHVGANGKLQDVRTIKIAKGVDEGTFNTIVDDLEQAALDDCEGVGGVQKYVVQALDEDRKAITRMPLRYSSVRSEDEAGDFDTEPANGQGITNALMRHVEARERIDKGGWGALINTQRMMIESLAEQNSTLVTKHMDFMTAMEEMAQLKHEREVGLLEQQSKAETRARIGRTITALLPALAKKVTGIDIGTTDPDTLSMRELLQTLTEEQIMQIQGVLSPEQTLALLSMLKGEAEKPPDNH